ncbi:MAG: YigZ family protein [Gammaproteobacteria bacterium]
MTDYKIPAQTTRFEQEIKKSRFIAFATCVESPELAHRFIKDLRTKFPDAGHVCSAFLIGEPGNTTQIGFSDDGEPSGTAGMPMLNVLQHGETGDIVVAVVRYFGGIKLGTGGLARAYSSSVTSVLNIMPLKLKVAMTSITFSASFALEDQIRRVLKSVGVANLNVEYKQELNIECGVPEDQLIELEQMLSDIGKGKIKLIKKEHN